MFHEATVRAVETFASRANLNHAALLAVAEVESGGKVYAGVGGRQEPLICWKANAWIAVLRGRSKDERRSAPKETLSTGMIETFAA